MTHVSNMMLGQRFITYYILHVDALHIECQIGRGEVHKNACVANYQKLHIFMKS